MYNAKYHIFNCFIVINALPFFLRKQRFLQLFPYMLITSFHCMNLLFTVKKGIVLSSIQDQNLWKINLMELILVLKHYIPQQILFKDFTFGINDRRRMTMKENAFFSITSKYSVRIFQIKRLAIIILLLLLFLYLNLVEILKYIKFT